MATATKPKNGTIGVDTMVDMAAEAKAAVETIMETAAKVNENGVSFLNAQQKIMKDSFALWQNYNQTYFDFVIEATQKSFTQALNFRTELSKVVETNFKQTQEIFVEEQKLVTEAVEATQAQVKAATERVNEMFAPVFEK